MSDERDFDPRFDPAFQRGYVAGNGTAPTQNPAGQGSEPTPQWTNPPQALDARARPDAPAMDAPASPAAPAAHPTPEPAVTLDGNPWVRVLWVIAPVFIIGGVVGQTWSQSRFMGGVTSSASDVLTSYVTPTIAQSICPWMILTGLAALVGVVFLHAVRWRRAE
ncbi:hypothetical protein [Salinibacterium sp.]|uniref:hypothetical protein n=1 Tax=Salinibacterium sp. TaxID=1915057 RepID=UPI00286C3341|nr:hypothetical protein [Salinibacterium sp.]